MSKDKDDLELGRQKRSLDVEIEPLQVDLNLASHNSCGSLLFICLFIELTLLYRGLETSLPH